MNEDNYRPTLNWYLQRNQWQGALDFNLEMQEKHSLNFGFTRTLRMHETELKAYVGMGTNTQLNLTLEEAA